MILFSFEQNQNTGMARSISNKTIELTSNEYGNVTYKR